MAGGLPFAVHQAASNDPEFRLGNLENQLDFLAFLSLMALQRPMRPLCALQQKYHISAVY
jgi:hypothetical protein